VALSLEIKHKIIRHLGFSAKSIIFGSTHYKSSLADALENLDSVSETSLIDLVNRIDRIDYRLEMALDRLAAMQIDDIQLREDEVEKLRAEKIRLIKEVGRLIDIAPQNMGGNSVNVCV
jgi:glutamine synthetase type III